MKIIMNSSPFIMIVMMWGTSSVLPLTEGGSCWANYDTLSGQCVALIHRRVSYEDCCRISGFSFIERDMSTEDIFRSLIMHGGVSDCLPCSSFGKDVCEGITCNRDEVCVARNGQPLCNCDPDCSDVDLDQPVCGSDRQTYTNECTFKMNRCQERRDVELAYYGQCQDSCDTVTCAHGTCLVDQMGVPHCVNCSPECKDKEVQGSVCGTDKNTYESICHLRLTSCNIGKAIIKNHNGRCVGSTNCSSFLCMEGNICSMGTKPHCSTCPQAGCGRYALRALCGSDDVTYANLCAMKRAICDTRVYVKRQHFGPCARDMSHIPPQDREAYFRYYLSFFHHEQVSEPATTALIRRLTTNTEESLTRTGDNDDTTNDENNQVTEEENQGEEEDVIGVETEEEPEEEEVAEEMVQKESPNL
ncbi:follistatin-A-like [Apostichopus japonicus]|uniref:follistatin-A-like n=1 Tax=Stichopus japonicus TaxID=307972 RepID=UPI003AB4C3D5